MTFIIILKLNIRKVSIVTNPSTSKKTLNIVKTSSCFCNDKVISRTKFQLGMVIIHIDETKFTCA